MTAADQQQVTSADWARFARLEVVVAEAGSAMRAATLALKEIHDKHLYRLTHPSFERYLAERWDISRARGYQLLDAAATIKGMSTLVDIPLPANEAQARELTGLPVEVQAAVMTEAATAGPVTAAAIRAARTRVLPQPAAPPPSTEPAPALSPTAEPAQPQQDDDYNGYRDEDWSPDAQLIEVVSDLQSEYRRMAMMHRLGADTEGITRQAAQGAAALVLACRNRRADIDLVQRMAASIKAECTTRGLDVIEWDIEAAIGRCKAFRVDPKLIRSRVVAQYRAIDRQRAEFRASQAASTGPTEAVEGGTLALPSED